MIITLIFLYGQEYVLLFLMKKSKPTVLIGIT